ncbi:MAG: SprT family zinc-dependent metalloprotease [Syntrophomonadaceae bacterium]|nr:SprT family zinc-dependent metalloprotease [Syntrophomonadaceae bacterium]
MTDYTLTRSKRKTVALYVRDDASIEVRAPLKMPKRDINKFVESKSDWIDKEVALKKEQNAARDDFELDYGSFAAYRGKDYPIEAKPGNRCGFDDMQFYVPPDLSPEQIKPAVKQVYRMLAKRDLSGKVQNFAKQMGVMPTAVKINGATTRWGSCSNRKSLNFSWRLMMAEDDVIDYVVVHELAHITEMSHSKRFWAIVERVLPDYRERKAKLKELQQRLKLEDWE